MCVCVCVCVLIDLEGKIFVGVMHVDSILWCWVGVRYMCFPPKTSVLDKSRVTHTLFWVPYMRVFCIFVFAPVQHNWACFTWTGTLEIWSLLLLLLLLTLQIAPMSHTVSQRETSPSTLGRESHTARKAEQEYRSIWVWSHIFPCCLSHLHAVEVSFGRCGYLTELKSEK